MIKKDKLISATSEFQTGKYFIMKTDAEYVMICDKIEVLAGLNFVYLLYADDINFQPVIVTDSDLLSLFKTFYTTTSDLVTYPRLDEIGPVESNYNSTSCLSLGHEIVDSYVYVNGIKQTFKYCRACKKEIE